MYEIQENYDHYEIVMWQMIDSLPSIKDCVEDSLEDNRREDLIELNGAMIEAGKWIKNRISV